MRIPDAGPLGETFFDARRRAIVPASSVKRPGGGKVENVFTCPDHLFALLPLPLALCECAIIRLVEFFASNDDA
jgi:hypothetical protein